MRRTLEWQLATVRAIKPETPRVRSFTFALPAWLPHRAGQHVDIRLTAPDGYAAQRSYSIASEPERAGEIELTVERIEDGEVSTYLHDEVVVGDRLEVRGPIGGYFVWEEAMGGPLLLIAGGSGVVPLMAMIRHRAASGSGVPLRLLYSSRMFDDVIYYDELERLGASKDGLEVFHTLTRALPEGWTGYGRRIDERMLAEVSRPFAGSALVFVCGPTLLVEAVASSLVRIGIRSEQIRTERFGPTGT